MTGCCLKWFCEPANWALLSVTVDSTFESSVPSVRAEIHFFPATNSRYVLQYHFSSYISCLHSSYLFVVCWFQCVILYIQSGKETACPGLWHLFVLPACMRVHIFICASYFTGALALTRVTVAHCRMRQAHTIRARKRERETDWLNVTSAALLHEYKHTHSLNLWRPEKRKVCHK